MQTQNESLTRVCVCDMSTNSNPQIIGSINNLVDQFADLFLSLPRKKDKSDKVGRCEAMNLP